MTTNEILNKLEPIFQAENLRISLVRQEEKHIELSAERTGPGAPVAFIIQAIQGTFKKYHKDIHEVRLAKYERNDHDIVGNDEMHQVANFHPEIEIELKGLPVLDLKGSSQKEAVRAIEGFIGIWKSKSRQVAFTHVEGPALDAAKKWAAYFERDYLSIDKNNDEWIIQLDSSSPLPKEGPREVLPAKAFLL